MQLYPCIQAIYCEVYVIAAAITMHILVKCWSCKAGRICISKYCIDTEYLKSFCIK